MKEPLATFSKLIIVVLNNNNHNKKARTANMRNRKEYQKAYRESHKEYYKAYTKTWEDSHKEHRKKYHKAYRKADLNSKGQTKDSIREKSWRILKKMNLHIPDYEIHHCFGYDDANKFIYISKALHLKIHAYLRDNNIPADSNHWMAIRDIVNNTDEFTYIKC